MLKLGVGIKTKMRI